MTKKQAERKMLAHEKRARAFHGRRHKLLIRIESLQAKAESLKGKAQKEADMANHYMHIWNKG